MGKTTRTTSKTAYRRINGRFKRVRKDIVKEQGKAPGKISDNAIIAQETDPKARAAMFKEKQKQQTKRSAMRNLTTQVATTGSNVVSGVSATQGLSQNIQGGASVSNNRRDDDEDPKYDDVVF